MTRSLIAGLLAASALASVAQAQTATVLGTGNTLNSFDTTAPSSILSTRQITGIAAGQTLVGIDARPVSRRVLYGLSNTGQLYAINGTTGAAVAVGAPSPAPAGAVGFDFNPAVDRIRVITATGTNYRLNPDTGALAGLDTPVAYSGTEAAGAAPAITGAAYTNNVPAAASTTLYGIDAARGTLVRVGSLAGATPVVSPNTGALTTVGALGADVVAGQTLGFDISAQGQVLATITNPVSLTTSLYSIDLVTGDATLVGQLGAAGANYNGLSFTPASFASAGVNANQAAVGAALDNFVGVPSAGLNGLFNSLDGLASDADRSDALRQLSPGSLALLPDLTLRAAEFQEQTVRRYLRDFRAGGTGVEGEAGVAAPGDRKLGLFVIGTGADGRYDATDDRSRVEFGAQGVMGGIDYRLGEKSLIGLTGGYYNLDVNLDRSSPRSNIESWFGGAYGTLGVGPLYVDLFGTYGEADYDLRRGVRFGATPSGFTTDLGFQSQADSKTYLGGGTIGLSFNFAGFEFEPFAGVRYAKLEIDAIDEGTGLGAIQLGENDYESVLGNFGLRIGGAIPVGNVTVRPEIRGAYRHEFQKDGQQGFTYGFGGPGSGPVAFQPTGLGRRYATAGAGFTISGPTSPLSVVVDYNGEFDADRRINSISGGLRFTF